MNLDGISQQISDATAEIFGSMVMLPIQTEEVLTTPVPPLVHSISGMIGLAGTCRGLLAVHFPKTVAMHVTSMMLGLEIDAFSEDVQDAVGEIANMIGGSLKSILSSSGKDIQLSLPSTIYGDAYAFAPVADVERLLLRFSSEAGSFHVEIELEAV